MKHPDTLQHDFAEVNGIRMHYVHAGTGKPVLFLHGFPEFWYCWRRQLPEIAQNFHAIAPDLRGYNLTDKPKKISDYALPTLAKDVLELIGHLGYEKVHFVAHDWGGAVAYYLAQHHPEVVDRLIILNSPHPHAFSKALNTSWKQRFMSWYMLFFQLPLLPEIYLNLFLKWFLRKSFQGWAIQKTAFTEEDLQEYFKAMRKKGALRAMLNWYRAGLRKAPPISKNQIQSPTLLLWGEDDKALGKALTLDNQKYYSQPLTIRYFSECSHWIQNEYPKQVNEAILEFLRGEL